MSDVKTSTNRHLAVWLVLLAAAGTFALTMGVRQVGGFLGAFLGGKVFDATGSYDWIWYVDIVLAVAAALIHLPIKEAKLPARAVAAA